MNETNLSKIHVFPSKESYKTNIDSVGVNDLALVPFTNLPIGTVLPFSSNSIPSGYLPCNGSEISRTTYADLFAVIGTTYGSGDGSTTFNLPNIQGFVELPLGDTAPIAVQSFTPQRPITVRILSDPSSNAVFAQDGQATCYLGATSSIDVQQPLVVDLSSVATKTAISNNMKYIIKY